MQHVVPVNDSNLVPVRVEHYGKAPASAKETSLRALQSLMVLGEMTGGIVHDFRILLTVIDSGLRLMERNSAHPEKVRMYIAAMRDGISRGVKLTSQLMALAKQHELEVHPGNVNELLLNLESFLNYASGPEIRITLKLRSDVPKCLIDPLQFNSAILNLVINARDAMLNGGNIQICTELVTMQTVTLAASGKFSPGAYIRVRVKDYGHGMSEDVVKKIFDPFFTTKGEKGTGLGLPQVCAFMRQIGGHVNVSSEQGFGTTVDLLFPSIEADGAEHQRKRD